MKQKISIIIVVIALAVGGWIIFSKKSGTVDKLLKGIGQEKEEATQVESSGFGGQIFEKVQQNPAEKLPDVNAFEEEINPYKEAYTNPFED